MLDEVRRELQRRLDELLAEADKLRHALRALAGAMTERRARGGTKAGVLDALAGGEAMTASEVAKLTGLGRASVSTTLAKLAKSGEVSKADRGYQLDGQAPRRDR